MSLLRLGSSSRNVRALRALSAVCRRSSSRVVGALLLTLVAGRVEAQLRTYCIPGARFTCFALAVQTTANTAGGTDVLIQVANRQGATIPGVTAQVAWSRLHTIELQVPTGYGGAVTSADPDVQPAGKATADGTIPGTWAAYNVGDGTSIGGWAVEAPYTQGGAEIRGCGTPPNAGWPFLRTCQADGEGAVEIQFATTGAWTAGEAAVGVVLQDEFGTAQGCLISGSRFDDPAALHCADYTNGAPITQIAQTVSFASVPPSPAYVGVSYAPTGAATSGLAATLSSLTPATCTVAGTTATFAAAGLCTLAFDQAGNAGYLAAPQSTQAITVVQRPQAITFSALPPASAPRGSTLTLGASGGDSGNPVTFATLTPTICTVAARVVSFVAVGPCTITADQTGDAIYLPAPQQMITITVVPPVFNAAMHLQPDQLSLSSTAVVNVILFSEQGFDAVAVNPANARLVVTGGSAVGPITRGGVVNTSVRDVNGDGLPDRLISFSMSALRAAGFSLAKLELVLRDDVSAAKWVARDATPPTVVP